MLLRSNFKIQENCELSAVNFQCYVFMSAQIHCDMVYKWLFFFFFFFLLFCCFGGGEEAGGLLNLLAIIHPALVSTMQYHDTGQNL